MPSTEHFVVNSETKKIQPSKGNSYSYWRGELKGTIDMQIDVFTCGDGKKEAQEIYDALVAAGLQDKYFSISVQLK